MRILFLTQILPFPLDAGPKIRAYYVLRYLARSHSLTLLSFSRPSDSPQAIQHLRQFCEQVITIPMHRSRWRDGLNLLRSLVNREPFIILRDRVQEMYTTLKDLIREQTFDAVHADQLWMAAYALSAKALQRSNIRTILDQHNAVFKIPQRMAENTHNPLLRWALQREARLLADYEIDICRRFDRIIWVATEDKEAVHSLGNDDKLDHTLADGAVIPICIAPQECQPIKPLSPNPNILFIGGMHWPPNLAGIRWFAQEVMPRVLAVVPEAFCFVIGKLPPKDIQKTAGIIAPGFVEDLEPYWRQCRVFIVPLLAGGGMRVKILEAWAHGLPVISTSIGAEGIAIRDKENIRIADTAQDFAESLVSLLKAGNAEPLASAGRATVEANYDWRKVYQAWDKIYST